jgi:hypothetical protein
LSEGFISETKENYKKNTQFSGEPQIATPYSLNSAQKRRSSGFILFIKKPDEKILNFYSLRTTRKPVVCNQLNENKFGY